MPGLLRDATSRGVTKADVILFKMSHVEMEQQPKAEPVRILRRTKSQCSDEVADAIYGSSPAQRRQSYDLALEHFKHSNARVCTTGDACGLHLRLSMP